MEKVLKTCNCCLDRNKTPVLMGVNVKIKRCRKCNARTVWEPMSAEDVAAFTAYKARSQALVEQLMRDE